MSSAKKELSQEGPGEGFVGTSSLKPEGVDKSSVNPQASELHSDLVVPPDGGWGWVVVAASFMCNVLVDGIIFSGGSLLTPIQNEFEVTVGQASLVNSLLAGFYLMAGPFVSILANRYGFRAVTIAGCLISGFAIGSSFFAPNIEFLYIIYGIIGGIGFCMIYMPAVVIIGFYFEKWRALATGLALCGSGFGTFGLSPLTDILVEKYGWRYTLLVHAGLVLTMILCGAVFRSIDPTQVVNTSKQGEEDSGQDGRETTEKIKMLNMQNGNYVENTLSESGRKINNANNATRDENYFRNNLHIGRRASANAALNPVYIVAPINEEVEKKQFNDNRKLLLSSSFKTLPEDTNRRKSQTNSIVRPIISNDIFFSGSLNRLPQYNSRRSLQYHVAVTNLPTKPKIQEENYTRKSFYADAIKKILSSIFDFSLLKSPTFLILALSGFFTMFSYFMPFLYVQSRALLNGFDKDTSKMLVPTIGIANIIGRVASGMISSLPKVSSLWLNNIALTVGAITTMISGLYYEDFYQFGYCFIFGLSCATFASLRSILVVEYLGLEKLTDCYGLFLLFQGLGAMIGSPVAGALKDWTENFDVSFYVSGGFLLFSALICYPIDCISRWEKRHHQQTDLLDA